MAFKAKKGQKGQERPRKAKKAKKAKKNVTFFQLTISTSVVGPGTLTYKVNLTSAVGPGILTSVVGPGTLTYKVKAKQGQARPSKAK